MGNSEASFETDQVSLSLLIQKTGYNCDSPIFKSLNIFNVSTLLVVDEFNTMALPLRLVILEYESLLIKLLIDLLSTILSF